MNTKLYVIKHVKSNLTANFVTKIDYYKKDYKIGNLEEAKVVFSFFDYFQALREARLLEEKFKTAFEVVET